MYEFADEGNELKNRLHYERPKHVSQDAAKLLINMNNHIVCPVGGVLEVHVDCCDKTTFQHGRMYYKCPERNAVIRFINACGYTFEIPNKKDENGKSYMIVCRNTRPVHKIAGTYSRLENRAIIWCIKKISEE